MRTSKCIMISVSLAAAVAGFVMLTGCEDKRSTDVAAMDDFSSQGRDNGSGPKLTVTPNPASVSHEGEDVLFTVGDGSGTYSWIAENTTRGTIAAQSNTRQAIYHTKQLGANTVFVTDSNGRTGEAKITVPLTTVKITPNTVTISTNVVQFIEFVATGGSAPYKWRQSMPSLGMIDPDAGAYTSTAGQKGQNTILATDADGNIGTATVTQQ